MTKSGYDTDLQVTLHILKITSFTSEYETLVDFLRQCLCSRNLFATIRGVNPSSTKVKNTKWDCQTIIEYICIRLKLERTFLHWEALTTSAHGIYISTKLLLFLGLHTAVRGMYASSAGSEVMRSSLKQ